MHVKDSVFVIWVLLSCPTAHTVYSRVVQSKCSLLFLPAWLAARD